MSLNSVSIDLSALQHNFLRVKNYASRSKILAVVKSNAYGHGLLNIVKALPDADGFAVFNVDEAIALRKNNIRQKIVVLSGFNTPVEISLCEEFDLIPVIHKFEQIKMLESQILKKQLEVEIKIDIGMHRLGFFVNQFDEVMKALVSIKNIHVFGILTHLPCADEYENQITKNQLTIMRELIQHANLPASVAHSPGIVAWPESHYDWVRPGIMLYGISPMKDELADKFNLKPVMTLTSQLISIRHLAANECIGYGAAWKCPEPMRVGIVAIGYGSGYPRHAINGTPVLVSGVRCPLIARVCMNTIFVDLRHHPQAKVDDSVILWGEGLPVEEVAQCSNTIPYELVCGVTL